MDYIKRQNKLKHLLRLNKLDALLIRRKQNIAYLTGIKGDDALFFASNKGNFLITDSRYTEEYAGSLKNYSLEIVPSSKIPSCIETIAVKTRAKSIGFESDNFSYSAYNAIKKQLKNKRLIPVKGLIESLRLIKDKKEVNFIKKACDDGCRIMNYAIGMIKPYMAEKQVKAKIEAYIAKQGLKPAGFEIIVASGKNAAMPHATASDKKIKDKEMIVIDLGAMNYGYNSDLTRTVFLGKINPKSLNIYNTVLEAQNKAIEYLRQGVTAGYIDNIARQYISDKGFGEYFIHSLGHGIGLEGHEKPHISSNNNTILEKDMVMTIEPGIYIPGWGGVRIEDDVLITEKGCEVLTGGCKKSLWK